MLNSEIRGWYYVITWDNPIPADSSAMLGALRRLGKVTSVQTKTTAILAPRKNVKWRQVRRAILQNLNRPTGNALYVNLRTGNSFQIGAGTTWRWKKPVP
jgi:hypothetical protein